MYQVGSACYPTDVAAATASASSVVGSVVVIGSKAYTVTTTSITGSVINYRFSEAGGSGVINTAAAYSAAPCGLLTIEDGLSLGWMVGAAWIAAFALLFITRALRGNDEGSNYGNA